MRTSRRSAALLLGVTLCALLLPAAPASADNYDYKLSAAVIGASGYVWFDFIRGRYGGDFTPTVSDTKCDGKSVYVSFYTDGGLYQKFQNSLGCNRSQSWGWRSFTYKYNQPASTTKYVYIKVCVADYWGDTCQTSARKYNPYA